MSPITSRDQQCLTLTHSTEIQSNGQNCSNVHPFLELSKKITLTFPLVILKELVQLNLGYILVNVG